MEQDEKVIDKVAAAQMLDKAINMLHLKNDAALSRVLEVAPPVVSKIRGGKLAIAATIIIKLHETTGLSVRQIKGELNMPCLTQRIHAVQ